MLRLRIILNNRKRFVFSAVLAAVLVLLAGGATALAQPTVRCVTKTGPSPNPSCTALTTYASIHDAVNAASPFDIIVVGPGTYPESVTIPVSLSLFGAQAGKDARVDRHDTTKESIVDASGKPHGAGHGAAFDVEASYVVIDGFTIQGGTAGKDASGIWVQNFMFSPQILNNIIENNAVGVYLYIPFGPVIEHNLFETNNQGTVGANDYNLEGTAGYGIAGSPSPPFIPAPATITENEFTGNETAAMYLYQDYFSSITRNTSENDGSFVILVECNYTQFNHNAGRNFGARGVLPVSISPSPVNADAAIQIDYGNGGLEISDNDLEEGKAPIGNGIAFSNILGSGPSVGCRVNNNRVTRFPGNGIVAEDGTGTVFSSLISGNEVEDNGEDGILIEGPASTYNYGNFLFENEAEGNQVKDCQDDTIGSVSTFMGTLGTANNWFNNIGNLSYPPGPPPLCTPGRGHYPD